MFNFESLSADCSKVYLLTHRQYEPFYHVLDIDAVLAEICLGHPESYSMFTGSKYAKKIVNLILKNTSLVAWRRSLRHEWSQGTTDRIFIYVRGVINGSNYPMCI